MFFKPRTDLFKLGISAERTAVVLPAPETEDMVTNFRAFYICYTHTLSPTANTTGR